VTPSLTSKIKSSKNAACRTCLAQFSILKMEATWSSETPVNLYDTIRPYVSDDRAFHNPD
jgi:hypothetical protein